MHFRASTAVLPHEDREHQTGRFQKIRWLLVLSWLCSHLCLWFSLNSFFSSPNVNALNAVYCANDLMVTLILHTFLFKWNNIVAQVRKITISLPKTKSGSLKRFSTFSIAVSIALSVVTLSLTGIDVFSTNPTESFDFYLGVKAFVFGSNLTSFKPVFLRFMMCTENTIYFWGQILPMNVVPTVIGCLSLILAQHLHFTNQESRRFVRSRPVVHCKSIAIIKKKYIAVRTLVAETDNHLGLTILLWFSTCLISNCCGVKSILGGFTDVRIVSVMIDIFYHAVPLLFAAFLSFCASRIQTAAEKGFLLARDLEVSCNCGQKCAYGQILVLMSHLSSPTTGLTLGGLLVVGKNTFFSHLGCIATFAILLLQLYPKMMDNFGIESLSTFFNSTKLKYH